MKSDKTATVMTEPYKVIIMSSCFSGRRWLMLRFFLSFRFAHDKDALLDLETIDDDLDQEGKSI